MADAVITIQGLSKTYLLYPGPQYRLWQFLLRGRKRFYTPVEALKPLDLVVKRGEAVGIVGRNGSGKSTLLQLLCGTLSPSAGDIEVNGRISALLELGAGFNPNFTGRENVYLNGAILGLSRQETEFRFADIAAFANIGEFIEQPVSTYSSGMTVRLAFAIAVAVDPDILVVDEALAVGDESFQRKCFARIEEMRRSGTTILFVSHAAQTVIDICDRALLMDQGELLLDGEPRHVITRYHKLIYATAEQRRRIREEIRAGEEIQNAEKNISAAGDNEAREGFDPELASESMVEYPAHGGHISNPRILTAAGEPANLLLHGHKYIFSYRLKLEEEVEDLRCGMLIKTKRGTEVAGTVLNISNQAAGVCEISFSFSCLLNPGMYFLNCGATKAQGGGEQYLHRLVDAVAFRVVRDNDKDDTQMTMAGLVNLEFSGKVLEAGEDG